jgi:uncharacterized protein (TIGR03437 family)
VPGAIYIGTDIGVFMTNNGGASWDPLMNGLPRTTVLSLKLHRRSRILRAATHGRSIFDFQLAPVTNTRQPWITAISPTRTEATTPLNLIVKGVNFDARSIVWWNGDERPTRFVDPTELRADIPTSDLMVIGRATVAAFTPGFGGGMSNAMNFTVGGAPSVDAARISSAATIGTPTPLVPGSLGVVLGTNLAPWPVEAQTPPLPNTLGGATIEINGTPAPLVFVSPNQITFQVPWELQNNTSGLLSATLGDQISRPVEVKFAAYAPALFSANIPGSAQGSIFIASSGQLAGPAGSVAGARPARRGEVVQIIATGLGSLSFRPSTGSALSGPPFLPYAITAPAQVEVGGAQATVELSAWMPGLVGLYTVLIEVPDASPSGDAVPVLLTIGGVKSNEVTMAVR